HPRAWRTVLCGPDPFDPVPGACRLCGAKSLAGAGGGLDHRRRIAGGAGLVATGEANSEWRIANGEGAAALTSYSLFATRRLPSRRRQLEALEREARRHRAADQRPRAETFRRLPCARRHSRLRAFFRRKIGAQAHGRDTRTVRDAERQRRTGI